MCGQHIRSFVVSACVALCVITPEASSVTPVEKVTQLLGNLEKKIEEQGKEEAISYDKYACFCKEQADNKQYAIETSNEKIDHMTAKLTKLGSEISDLDGEIQGLRKEIKDLGDSIVLNQQTRDGEHETFSGNLADANGAIDAVQRAIAAMKDSKKAMVGKADLESMAQVSKFAKVALAMHSDFSDADLDRLSFLATGDPGQSSTYKYRSNDIIATLETLRDTFRKRRSILEGDEFQLQSAHELKQQGLSNEKKFAEKESREKGEVRESKAEDKEATENDKAEETKDRDSDSEFLKVLQDDCENKAKQWDQRSQTRAAELTAISEAMQALKSGVAPNYSANKKLVGLQKHSAVKGHWVFVKEAAASFLQIQGVSLRGASRFQNGNRAEVQLADRVHQLLATSAAKLQSPILSMAALKVSSMSPDHFVKVRGIIKDLIQRLEDQATAEETQKNYCDKQTEAAVTKRDEEQSKIEDNKAQIDLKNSAKQKLQEDIAELSKQIAENKKALLEATTLREEESKENDKTIEDAGVGKEQVEFALNTLEKFYNQAGGAFVQYVPPKSDREGLTVADRAPETFDSDYHGSGEESKGIIGLLNIILSDFDRTLLKVKTDEGAAQQSFDDFKKENEGDTNIKAGSVDSKNTEITGINDDVVNLEDALESAQGEHKAALATIASLHSMCVEAEETYEERVAKRNKEVEALKEAHGILEDWQK